MAKLLGLTALTLSLSAMFVPMEQFAVAILASVVAIISGFYGEVAYSSATAAVTALNMAMLNPHDDLIMSERPTQVYCTALLWAVAPIVSMFAGHLVRLYRSNNSSAGARYDIRNN